MNSSSPPDELDSSRSQIEMKFIEHSSQGNRRAQVLAITTKNAKAFGLFRLSDLDSGHARHKICPPRELDRTVRRTFFLERLRYER